MPGWFDSSTKAKNISKLADLVLRQTVEHEGGNDPRWAETTVKLLVKNIKSSKQRDQFEKAVINQDALTGCCIIEREVEDKKKALFKKDKPHITYLKLWRYPWLKSHNDVKAVNNCTQPYSKTDKLVCVNPFHYDAVRLSAPVLPPIIVDKTRDYFSSNSPNVPQDEMSVPNASINEDEMRRDHCLSEENSPSNSCLNSPTDEDVVGRSGQGRSSLSNASPDVIGQSDTSVSSPMSPQSYLSEDLTYQEDNNMMEVDDDCVVNEAMAECPAMDESNRFLGPQHALRTTLPPQISTSLADRINTDLVEYCESPAWMSIQYYEESVRVGETFDAVNPYILIDGFSSPPNDPDRFSIGYIHSLNRPFSVAEARRQVGRGARFYYIGGEIYCECLSDSALFVQSPNCNQRHRWHTSTVCKVPPRCNLKVFNNAEFAAQLAASVEKGFQAVYALTRLCTIRMSFVKGWGADYRRQKVTEAPCWIEAHLNGPLQWIDRVLISMGAPAMICSSRT